MDLLHVDDADDRGRRLLAGRQRPRRLWRALLLLWRPLLLLLLRLGRPLLALVRNEVAGILLLRACRQAGKQEGRGSEARGGRAGLGSHGAHGISIPSSDAGRQKRVPKPKRKTCVSS
ncbi:hypothetical protein [Paracraurococcus ruber]|uniref:hypothetical protein n=1 Tax=Paracraurococcus ruber TaxID=77675 RepID=UPI001A93568B|nr:hypothetical protein [Paracraurococcus ruber]